MKENVLIVDDSFTVRMDLKEAMESAGFSTILCSTLAEARKALEKQECHLLVLDMLLPDGDGVELLKELRARPSTARMPVIFLTSEAEAEQRTRGVSTGADDYVSKPYARTYLVARVRELLSRQAAPGNKASTQPSAA